MNNIGTALAIVGILACASKAAIKVGHRGPWRDAITICDAEANRAYLSCDFAAHDAWGVATWTVIDHLEKSLDAIPTFC